MQARMRTYFQVAIVVTAVLLAVLALAGTALAQGADPALGTWRLNVAKSTYSGSPAPKSQTVKYEKAGMATTVTVEGVGADGTKTLQKYSTTYDGKDVPISGSTTADTVSQTRVDARPTVRTDKKAGKVVSTLRRTVAADGKTLTVVTTGTNAQGQPINSTAVYERQS